MKTLGGVGERVTHPSALDGGEFSTYAVGVLPPQDISPLPLVHVT